MVEGRSSDELQELVYTISHDFGRPIRHVVAFAELLRSKLEGELDEESREWFAYLQRAGSEAALMLERLLQYSRLAEPPTIAVEMPVRELCIEAIRRVGASAETRNIDLQCEGAVIGDPKRIATLLEELVDNALCYGPGPGVVRVASESRGDGLLISIYDAGEGIPAAQLDAARRPFGRLGPEDDRRVGLGLNICQRILDHYDAELGFCPSQTGNCVSFVLPAAPD